MIMIDQIEVCVCIQHILLYYHIAQPYIDTGCRERQNNKTSLALITHHSEFCSLVRCLKGCLRMVHIMHVPGPVAPLCHNRTTDWPIRTWVITKEMYKSRLAKGELTMFPLDRIRKSAKEGCQVNRYDTLFRLLWLPNAEDNLMVQCSECEEWYHIHCVDVPKTALKDCNQNLMLSWTYFHVSSLLLLPNRFVFL